MTDELPLITKTGKVLTDADIEALADEAERGYDVSHLAAAETRRRSEVMATTMPSYGRNGHPSAFAEALNADVELPVTGLTVFELRRRIVRLEDAIDDLHLCIGVEARNLRPQTKALCAEIHEGRLH